MNRLDEHLHAADEAVLARKAGSGDRSALAELLKRYERGLFVFVSRFVGGVADPADVYQEIILRAIQNMHRFNPKLSFRTWIYTLAANHCKNVLRSNERRGKFRMPSVRSGSKDEEIDAIETAIDVAPGPDKRLEGREFMDALERELANLPLGQREVFILREFDGIPFKEISSILKIPEATARSRMFLAVEYLRTRLRRFASGGSKK